LDDRAVERALAIAREDEQSLLVVVGPTASGKTQLAVALAEQLRGEVIGADSVQVYRHFDIGSGKPTAEERARAPHHLLDVFDPLESMDAAEYARKARLAIGEVRARGKRPLVCGGTFLWIKALLFGLAEAPPASEAIREQHKREVLHAGRASLHARLAVVDPPSAARLHPNDLVRVGRALEVYELSGKPMSAWQQEHGFAKARYPARLLGIERERGALQARIEERVARWLAAGWVDEVRALVSRGYGQARAMGSVGYREVRAHVAGELTETELAPAIVRATRVFARRQGTWLKQAEVTWL
jgi:tRNA dimethylallyltransferase